MKNATPGSVTFKSKYANHRVVLEPTDYDIVGRHRVRVRGKDAQFLQGLYTTSDQEKIELLRNHGMYGIDFIELENQTMIADNPEQITPAEPTEPPAVKPQRRGARTSKVVG